MLTLRSAYRRMSTTTTTTTVTTVTTAEAQSQPVELPAVEPPTPAEPPKPTAEDIAAQDALLAERDVLIKVLQEASPATRKKPLVAYFNFRGIMWPGHALLRYKKVEYEAIEMSIEAWMSTSNPMFFPPISDATAEIRTAQYYPHLPRYVDSDVDMQQSDAIMRYLGRKHGMLATAPAEVIRMDQIHAICYDAVFHYTGMFQTNLKGFRGFPKTQREIDSLHGKMAGKSFHKYLGSLQTFLESNPSKSGFMLGDNPTVTDFYVYNILANWYKVWDPEQFSKYPVMQAFIQRIAELPGVKEYILNDQPATTWLPGQFGHMMASKPNLVVPATCHHSQLVSML